jgi:hypothetical protein
MILLICGGCGGCGGCGALREKFSENKKEKSLRPRSFFYFFQGFLAPESSTSSTQPPAQPLTF